MCWYGPEHDWILYSTRNSNELRIINPVTGNHIGSLSLNTFFSKSLAHLRSESLLISGGAQGELSVYQLTPDQEPELFAKLNVHEPELGGVNQVQLVDSSTILSSGRDGRVCRWIVDDLNPIAKNRVMQSQYVESLGSKKIATFSRVDEGGFLTVQVYSRDDLSSSISTYQVKSVSLAKREEYIGDDI